MQVAKKLQQNINFMILSDEVSINKTAEVISNKIYSLKIIDNQKTIDVDFIQSIGSTFALHNTDEEAHSNIVSLINKNVSDLNNEISNKVDKIDGKTLSTNDLTNLLKSNYDSAYTNSHTHNNKILLDNLISSGNGNYYLTNDGTYKSVNLGMIINAIGTTSSNQTLPANQITKASFNGTPTITLPTISDSTKETTVILDFTTTSSSYPVIDTTGLSLKWNDKNKGMLPSFSTLSGVRNRIIFKTSDGGVIWEAEYSSYGGVEMNFIRPNLTSNGTMGGSSFAVRANDEYYFPAWQSVDGNSSSGWQPYTVVGARYDMYNPQPLKATSINITYFNSSQYIGQAGSIYGSNDDSNYTFLTSFSGNASANLSISIPSNVQNYYKYYRYINTAGNTYLQVQDINLAGTYIATS